MEGFVNFFQRLWLSTLPTKLVYAICTAAVFELLVWLINRQLHSALRPALQRLKTGDPQTRAARMKLLLRPPKTLVRASLYLTALAIILRIFGFPLRLEVLPILGVFCLAALVALWKLLQDCVWGYVLLYQNAFAPGEEISIGDTRGVVQSFSLPTTELATSDGVVRIANSSLRHVVNHSRKSGEPASS
ncbi:MAG: mechanosensitive ion channel [Armatimonadetes bacterium]|nr:mechanosensitive ion channel [Armatimonadota bacterium]